MDKYEMIEIVGEGSYGIVMKCKHRESGQFVAIKRFLETEEDYDVRIMAFREIRMLKKLRHDNLVNMIEVFRRKKRFYLVFEYLDHTLLNELENVGRNGLGLEISKRYIYQILRGLDFCHSSNIMHRDIKPENILISPNGVVKLCDFGFARFVNSPNESCTDYVATRWYRAPELLVGDPRYGRPIDIWAVGCLYAEMMVGNPLFPGKSDVDQLYRITKILGGLCMKHQSLIDRTRPGQILRHASADELIRPPQSGVFSIRKLFPKWDIVAIDFLAQCLRMDPDLRSKSFMLLEHPFFIQDRFADKFLVVLRKSIDIESSMNPLSSKMSSEKGPSISTNLFESSSKTVYQYFPRWHMHSIIVKDLKNKTKSEAIDTMELRQTSSSLLRIDPLKNSRKVCNINTISVIPKTTYIRKVKKKGIAMHNY
ncbi:cyclin-dependent kinase-like 4 isoform X1 [Apis dorsata]|uniref:cyclin-dependent kinase-like 4 isoform X1 n=2 Tax=Apis dorsata TaxID=7462 RepID=UPI001293D81A|nr:cyclin-dependent kinase-like 4 isoform X1 [Apis dorsata]